MMKSPQGWVQGYNAQIMVEESSGVIVAQEVSNQGVDTRRLGPMLEILEQNLTRLGVPRNGAVSQTIHRRRGLLQRRQPEAAGR